MLNCTHTLRRVVLAHSFTPLRWSAATVQINLMSTGKGIARHDEKAGIDVALLHFHHIYSSKKKKAIIELTRQHNLGGLYRFGRPGRVLVEGEPAAVARYCTQIKALRWQHVTVVATEKIETRAFSNSDFCEVSNDRELGRVMSAAGLTSMFKKLFQR